MCGIAGILSQEKVQDPNMVISIAIYDQVESLNYASAHQLSAILLAFAFLVLLAMFVINRRWERQ
jgi:ABC-type molybdate transport system permease subunit